MNDWPVLNPRRDPPDRDEQPRTHPMPRPAGRWVDQKDDDVNPPPGRNQPDEQGRR